MLNREGGDIILGVNDKGTIIGVEATAVESLKADLVALSNNRNKLDPPFILFPQSYETAQGWIIHIQIPASSLVHKTANHVYDRSSDGDFRVSQPHQIAEIYNQKRTHYTEGIIYRNIHIEDFKQELFPKLRNLIRSNNANHLWLALDDEDLLRKAGLRRRDFQSGEEGYTLAAVLLLGKDESNIK